MDLSILNKAADVSDERVYLIGYRFVRRQIHTLLNMGTWLM
jgi:hypothetical protein